MLFFDRIIETDWIAFLRPRRIILVLLGLLIISALPLAYHESWLDPFSTLNVPNHLLKPHSITLIAYVPSDNPAQTLVLTDHARVQELVHDLGSAEPLPGAEPLDPKTILHFTLHREASRFHEAADFALEFDPHQGTVRFAGQIFHLPEAGQLYLTNLPKTMQSGWFS